MSDRSTKRESGFTLMEMVIAICVGTIVLGVAVQLYSQGVGATLATSQRAELQQDFRAASNILTRDLSLAGAGLTQGAAITLPSTTTPVYGCAQTGASPAPCYLGSGNNAGVGYPLNGTTAYLYGLLPGYNDGPTLPSSQGPTDAVTVVYTDNNFYLDCYQAAFTNSTTVTFTLPASASTNCTSPNPSDYISPGDAATQAVSGGALGLTPGDLVLFSFTVGTTTTQVVAEVTAVSNGVVTFAAGDALKMNQGTSVANSLAYTYHQNNSVTGYGTRLLVITYYIDDTPTPPRLMQQISGHTPAPVAENLAYLKFTYDLYNGTIDPPVQQCNPGYSTTQYSCNPSPGSSGYLPNQIVKINIQNMAMNSTLMGYQYLQSGYSRMDLQTSVSARNLTYTNLYPVQ